MSGFWVQVSCRLVQHQQFAVPAKRDGDQQFLLLPAGELDERLTVKTLHVQPQPSGDLLHTLGISTAQSGGKAHQLAHRHFQRRGQLRNKAHFGEHRAALLTRIHAIHENPSLTGVFTQQTADQRGLAGAVGTHQRHAVATFDGEIYALEHLVSAKPFDDALKLNHRLTSAHQHQSPATTGESEMAAAETTCSTFY